jgi:plastocyanin domain-containing protein
MTRALFAAAALAFAGTALAADAAKVEVKVTDDGFQPKTVKAKKGQPLTMVFTRTTENTCITAIDIPDLKVKEFELPLNKPVSLTVTPTKAGTVKFACSAMGMGDGKIVVE